MSYGSPAFSDNIHLTKPIVDLWKGLIARCLKSKQRFNDRAEQIMSFYSGGPTAMWEPSFINQFLGGPLAITAPRFKIQLNIAFEQVAILGPMLFWEMADRKVRPHRQLQLDIMPLAGGDPQLEQAFEERAQMQAMDDARNEMRARTLEHMLNYFQREQPGGLSAHSDLAVFEALTKGAGFLKTEPYRFPFSDRTLVGSFFESVDNVLVDANCNDPLWLTADYVIIRCQKTYTAVEKIYNLPPGSMQAYTSLSSQNSAFETAVPDEKKHQTQKDLVEYYEIYSRAGFGNALTGRKEGLQHIVPEFDAARGTTMVNGRPVEDTFVYLAICPHCPYPLNLPAYAFEVQDGYTGTAEWIKEQTNWPTEYWRDNKWPVEMLALYPHSGTSAWPEAPLASCLGELTCLNILMSCLVQEVYDGRQVVVGYKKGAIADIQALKTSDKSPLFIELDPQFNEKIDEVLEFMQRPEVKGDIPSTIGFLREMIERRTGLSDMLYGGNSGANPRSATEFQGKMDTVNIRPENMQRKVASLHSSIADKEVFCSYIHVGSQDIAEQLGPLGVVAWDMLVTNEAPEAILRGSKAVVEASGIRRPNKAKDREDLQGMMQYLFPILEAYATSSGDWGPMNGFIEAFGEAGEMDVTKFLFPPPQPPDENAQAMQQATLAELQAKAQKLMADAEKSHADAQSSLMKGETSQQDAQLKMQVAEHGMALKQQTAEHAAGLKAQQAELGSVAKQQEMVNKQGDHEMSMEQRRQEAMQKLGLNLLQAIQQQHQGAATHVHQTGLADQKAMDDAKRGNMITAQKMLQSAAMHDQRMAQTRQGVMT